MSNIKLIRPVLTAKNLKDEVRFFGKLGFQPLYDSVQYYEKFDYAVLVRDGVQIHIQPQKQETESGNTHEQTIRVLVNNLSELQEELSGKGFSINRQDNTQWQTDEFVLYSPSNNAVIFQQDLK